MELNGLWNSSPFVTVNTNIFYQAYFLCCNKKKAVSSLSAAFKSHKKCQMPTFVFREKQPLWMSSCSENRRHFTFIFHMWAEMKNFFSAM